MLQHLYSWCGDLANLELSVHAHEDYCLGYSRVQFGAFLTGCPPQGEKHYTVLESYGLACGGSAYTV